MACRPWAPPSPRVTFAVPLPAVTVVWLQRACRASSGCRAPAPQSIAACSVCHAGRHVTDAAAHRSQQRPEAWSMESDGLAEADAIVLPPWTRACLALALRDGRAPAPMNDLTGRRVSTPAACEQRCAAAAVAEGMRDQPLSSGVCWGRTKQPTSRLPGRNAGRLGSLGRLQQRHG
jgi:hypothetical protein